ncbi:MULTISPECIES: SOUL family heme-binding protein [Acidiphilium]|uniref:SOUL family heme-binding protein n=1 Tax=Acidiphilium TaxID=522 RepID=UPI000970E491
MVCSIMFTMPSAFTTIEMLPEPKDPRVILRSLPATRVAVLRFSGLAHRSEIEAKDAELLDPVRFHHFQPIGPVTLAQYNPPWTPWFMCRNEVMVALSPG